MSSVIPISKSQLSGLSGRNVLPVSWVRIVEIGVELSPDEIGEAIEGLPGCGRLAVHEFQRTE
jgi:hypothetical protein